jgi:phosphoribosylanthranilate isomerase
LRAFSTWNKTIPPTTSNQQPAINNQQSTFRMVIKASRITNLTDARYFAARDVNFLGFHLEEGQPGFLDPIYMKAIREWVEGPEIVGEFSSSPLSVVREAAGFFGLSAVQVPAPATAAELSVLQGLTVLVEAPVPADPDGLETFFQEAAPYAAWFVVFFTAENAGQPLDLWKNLCARYPVMLHFDLPAGEWPGLLEAIRPRALSLTGGEEEAVGVKSFDDLEMIFEFLEG